ncbi:Glyoxalase/Bleomycin resistance protein/Dihydroxybiphenyl dioxygenase [Mollisia scopiformis]|uniref:Glyoxalase/Bleomycin resistance protein/Dihydroxybiphenyl dioxygenase n=1 Tax=Mollisia scopiformis TaxID=149040 RepID=A0A194XJ75_MOLSC|nr:Glyoxalase/Bleomycin resistance protein/Dihydroxybiphenyl dioxygenase [Mollisia scopiformis]KUJ20176.1 Glyoxalase/Bleomycin resistance protein/Dihydroxybiphenyl dioxygenase [Mollisia scopiformis]
MAPRTSTMINLISWTDIPVTDISRAKEFYSTIFGWTFPTFGPPPTEPVTQALFKKGSMNGSFILVEPEKMISSVTSEESCVAVRVTITVESVDEKIVEIEKAGGKLYLPKKELPGGRGFTLFFTDTEGNVMGLWSKE